jgi:murein DD-endopeptidase MepM/ murein hydrolase activator NlpD
MSRLAAVLISTALFAFALNAKSATVIDYHLDPSIKARLTNNRPAATCSPDEVYQSLRAKYFHPPIDVRVRSIGVRVPYQRSANPNATVGLWGHTRDGGTKFHAGIDLLADVGEEVIAAVDGVAEGFRNSPLFGNYVTLTFAVPQRAPKKDCTATIYYAHLSEIYVAKPVGVKVGQMVGLVGRTGYDTKEGGTIPTHLHLELWLAPYVPTLEYRKRFTRDLLPLISSWRKEG